jgi:hypothetical protein
MPGESTNGEPGRASSLEQLPQREQVLAAIIVLLGKETDYQKRVRASHQLARVGPEILPLLLRTLHTYPEITSPAWPWWPPQYEQISRLLIQLSQQAHVSLEDLLRVPYLSRPPGPVLWTSVMQAAGLLPHMEYDPLLRAGLHAPWWTARYAAATAVANRAAHTSLSPEMRQELYQLQSADSHLETAGAAPSGPRRPRLAEKKKALSTQDRWMVLMVRAHPSVLSGESWGCNSAFRTL